MKDILARIHDAYVRMPHYKPLDDYFEASRHVVKEDCIAGQNAAKWAYDESQTRIRNLLAGGVYEISEVDNLHDLAKRCALFLAPDSFDHYLQYIEWNRRPAQRFYLPRRHYLLPIVSAYQQILDGELDFLSVSMPKRTGKSQTAINFVNMISGRKPEKATLMEGAGDALVRSFYLGCLEVLQSPEYLHYDVFPAPLVQTNADIKTINLDSKSRFPTIMCRSIDATQVGLSEATNLLYLDDLVEGREEALNRSRLDQKWDVLRGDVLGRRLQGTPIVATGTRYSLYDPIGRLQDAARELGWRWKSIEIPALDSRTDESNYEHVLDGKKVFTTEYLRKERTLLSAEQWESEFQQQPFEAKGLLFPKDELNYYFELPPDKDPDAIIAACDTAESGADSVAMPIAYLYGDDVFVVDVVFDNGPPDVTKPQCAKLLVQHKVGNATFESNNAGEYYSRDVDALVRSMGGKTSIQTKRTISKKLTRIELASDAIKKRFFFRHMSKIEPGSPYALFMREVTTFTRTGKNKHDDAPDSLSLLENKIRNLASNKVEIRARMF